ncbi:PREDICTED: trichohyalin isoform X1 [Drosophila arizonae]|uniref:Trichohyalin isoform X1 n=1 Tax=Drosophila arizonae TaxID=7263 RepID=A0ABM1P6K8_DROAR|nr:PREDICTED: trichohyalin isoform X1 [Drosophila arizonae]
MSSNRSRIMLSCLAIITLGLLTSTCQAQLHMSASSAGVSFDGGPAPQSADVAVQAARPHNRRMYAMCPPQFQRVGTDCYSLVDQRSSWLEAYFFCKDKNANLAEPGKNADRKLRIYLERVDSQSGEHDPIWIGGTYDHRNKHWQWSTSGRNLTYDAFSQMDSTYMQLISNSKPLDNNCAVYDPSLKYRWSARSCPDKLRFICQHKMPKVSEANRYKIYNRWNETYPNQLANEVVLEVINRRGKDNRYHRRVKAEGSNEEMIIPARKNRPANRRYPGRNRQQQHPNDINYQQRPRKQRPRVSTTVAPAPLVISNNVTSTSATRPSAPTTQQQMTAYDRILQRQREKERNRQQRKRERRQRMRQERLERQRKMREEKRQRKQEEEHQRQQQQEHEQLQQQEPPSEPEALRQRAIEEQQKKEREQREQLDKQEKQQRKEQQERELERLKQQHEIEERQRAKDDEALRLREQRLQKQRELEAEEKRAREELLRKQKAEQEEADRRYAAERAAEEKRLREEHEKRLQEAKSEQERQLQEAREAKRREQKAIEERLKEQERQRQEQIRREQQEEEKRLELERLEEARRFEQRELERLHEENERREARQRQREAEIAQREAEERKLAEEEERLRQELQEEEKARKRQLEQEIERAEQERKQKEEAEKAAAAAKAEQQKQKLEAAKRIADAEVAAQLEEKRRQYAARIGALSKEDQLKFIEMRKKRKQLRERQMKAREQKKLKRIQDAIRLNEMQ